MCSTDKLVTVAYCHYIGLSLYCLLYVLHFSMTQSKYVYTRITTNTGVICDAMTFPRSLGFLESFSSLIIYGLWGCIQS